MAWYTPGSGCRGARHSSRGRRGERRCELMHDDHDPLEYAKALEETADLGRNDMSEPRGISRRELLKRGAVGAAAVSGVGALAGRASAAASKSGKFTGTLRVISLGVE